MSGRPDSRHLQLRVSVRFLAQSWEDVGKEGGAGPAASQARQCNPTKAITSARSQAHPVFKESKTSQHMEIFFF